MYTHALLPALSFLSLAYASPMCSVRRAESTTCPSYTLIDTRGTTEPQGPSVGFRTMNARILAALSGGKVYSTVYPAAWDQNSTAGTADIVRQIKTTRETSPNECFILLGYSQGAQATVNAMPLITGADFDSVKGVFLIGDPAHKSGLTCNVDQFGGTTTRDVDGISAASQTGIPSDWVAKTLDVCILGDGVCDIKNGVGITQQHLQYPTDEPTQNLGTTFVVKQLGG